MFVNTSSDLQWRIPKHFCPQHTSHFITFASITEALHNTKVLAHVAVEGERRGDICSNMFLVYYQLMILYILLCEQVLIVGDIDEECCYENC